MPKSNKKFNNKDKFKKSFKSKDPMDKDCGHTNHPEWYNGDKQMVEDAARISFAAPLGQPIPDSLAQMGTVPDYLYQGDEYAVPGIMAIRYYTALGNLNGLLRSIIQVAADQIYANIRKANSGARNYEPADYMQYLLAVDAPLQLLCIGQRAYGLAMKYQPQNFYYLKPLLHACGFDYDDIITNLAKLRYGINAAVARMNSLYIPSVMPLYNRHIWMASNVFKDSQTEKHQLYVFKPNSIYKYRFAFGPNNVGGLQAIPVYDNDGHTVTVDSYLVKLNALIDDLFAMEDVTIMSGDTFKAYGIEGCISLSPMPIDYTIDVIYDEDILNQINNATLVGAVDKTSLSVYQDAQSQLRYMGTGTTFDPDQIYEGSSNPGYPYIPVFNHSERYNKVSFPTDSQRVINSIHPGAPTPDQVMSMTRLCAMRSNGVVNNVLGKVVRYVTNFGTEIAQDAVIYTMYRDKSGTMTFELAGFSDGTFNPLFEVLPDNDNNTLFNFLYEDKRLGLRLTSAFRFAPAAREVYFIYFNEGDKKSMRAQVLNWTQQWNNYTFINDEVLDRLHYVAIQSLFGIPFIRNGGTFSLKR